MKLEENSFNEIRNILLARKDDYGEIYLIGGYVRDYLLNIFSKDLDFIVIRNSTKAAREIADYFSGDFFMLDHKRETARALIPLEHQKIIVDVALINGENIFDDLKKRDFTINAMAINLAEPGKIIDPLGGKRDLQQKILHPCSETAFSDDPIRMLRAVRFIQALSLSYDPQIKTEIIEASKKLFSISAERIRDEVCQILKLPEIDQSIERMFEFNLFSQVFPDLLELIDISPNPPHVHDAFTHSKRVAELMRSFVDCTYIEPKEIEDKFLTDVYTIIGKYKKSLIKYFDNLEKLNLSIYSLLSLACLYHDSAKTKIPSLKEKGKTIFPNHAEKSADIVQNRMRDLAFSNEDINFVRTIIRYHMTDHLKTIGEDEKPNRRIYRYFKETGNLGVMIGLFHLADVISTYEETLSSNRWKSAMKSVDRILDGWFNHFDDVVSPIRLLNGDDLIEKFGLKSGRELGEMLERIREEQAVGAIFEKSSAIKFAEKMISEKK